MAEQKMIMAKSSSRRISAQRIMCPLCPNVQGFSLHRLLLKHLKDFHEVKITRSSPQFANFEEFTVWRNLGNREVDYVCQTTRKDKKGEKIILYTFNRSDTKGYISNCKKRNMKIGGSIKIKGVCPSRIEARIMTDGQVSTDFVETHIGHEDELRSKRLKKAEELQIVDRLKIGVPNKRILQDAREIGEENVTRMKVLTPQDLMNIRLKHKIDNQRHKDDMVGTGCSSDTVDEVTRLHINEPTTSQMEYQDDVKPFIEKSTWEPDSSTSFNCYDENPSDEELIRKIKLLDQEKRKELNRWLMACTESQGEICKKKRIEKQTYYPKI